MEENKKSIKRINTKEYEKINKLKVEEDLSVREIAEKYGVRENCIYKILERYNMQNNETILNSMKLVEIEKTKCKINNLAEKVGLKIYYKKKELNDNENRELEKYKEKSKLKESDYLEKIKSLELNNEKSKEELKKEKEIVAKMLSEQKTSKKVSRKSGIVNNKNNDVKNIENEVKI